MKYWTYPFAIGCMFGSAVVFMVGRFGPVNPTKVAYEVTGPGDIRIKVNTEGKGVDYESLLEKMFDNNFMKSAAIGWLGNKHNIYPLEDERLVTAIEQRLCDKIPEKPLKKRLIKAKECAVKLVADKLRKLAINHKPPFHYVGFEGDAGFLAGPGEPKKGIANVCRNGQFFGKRLQVLNPATNMLVEVDALRSLGVCTKYGGYPDIQLGSNDTSTLFGNQQLSRTEKVIIIPL